MGIFAILAVVDLRKKGRQSQRWREYLFLATAVAVMMVYGVINDLITAGISWEYFHYGKGVDVSGHMRLNAAIVGLKATWTGGLLVGAALLLANNPSRRWPQLPYSRLIRALCWIVASCAFLAVIGGVSGYRGWLSFLAPDVLDLARDIDIRPRRFMCVLGIHLGGYVGGLLSTEAAVVWLILQRRRLAPI